MTNEVSEIVALDDLLDGEATHTFATPNVYAGIGLVIAGNTISLAEPMRGILIERSRQKGLPGSEFDLKNSPNDWIAIAARYLGESGRRGANLPSEEDFRDSLVKAAAVILAAIEHIPVMSKANHFTKS